MRRTRARLLILAALAAALAASFAACKSDDAPGKPPRPSARERPSPEQVEGKISARLMTLARWKERFPGPARPYSFTVRRGDRQLVYCGLPHTSDPGDPFLVWMERRFSAFARETAGKPRSALVEGRVRKLRGSRGEAVRESGGEGGLLTYLAHREGIPVECPEPGWEDLFSRLREERDLDAICHAYRLRGHLLAARRGAPVGAGEIPDGSGPLAALGCDVSPLKLDEVHQRLYGEPVSGRLDDAGLLARITDPAGPGPVSEVMASDARVRDVAIAMEIWRRWGRGESVFALFGAAHARMQEPALREVLGR